MVRQILEMQEDFHYPVYSTGTDGVHTIYISMFFSAGKPGKNTNAAIVQQHTPLLRCCGMYRLG